METRRLRAFIKIVDLGSLTRAAQHLCVAQPALSQQVLALEHEFGAPLLERSRTGVTPTAAGRALYRHAQVILKQIAQAKADVNHAVSAELTGVVSMGMPLSSAVMIVGPLLEAVRATCPGVHVHLSEALNGTLLRELTLKGQLDMVLLPDARQARGLSVQPLFTEELVFVASKTAARKLPHGPIDIEKLAGQPLFLPSRNTHVREIIENAFQARGCKPLVIAEADSAYSLREAIQSDFGSTILTAASAKHAGLGLHIRPIAPPAIERPMALATFDGASLSAPAAAVYAILTQVITRLIESGRWPGARLISGCASASALQARA